MAGFEDDISSSEETPAPVQVKLSENPLSKQRHSKRESNVNTMFESMQISKNDSASSIEQSADNFDANSDQNEVSSDVFNNWLGQNSKWRQSPEGGEDVHNSSRKDRSELSDRDLDHSVTSSNVHLDLLDGSSGRHASSGNSSPVMKEKKKHKEKVI